MCCFCLAALGAACQGRPQQREYRLQGQVLSITPNHQQATINHEEIKGFMAAMTMPYTVHDAKQLEGIAPGDLVNAKLVVLSYPLPARPLLSVPRFLIVLFPLVWSLADLVDDRRRFSIALVASMAGYAVLAAAFMDWGFIF